MREAPLDAGVAPVDGRVAYWGDGGHLLVADMDPQRAAHSAVPAGGDGRTLDGPRVEEARLGQRAGRAAVHAAAAADARRGHPRFASTRPDDGVEAAPGELEGERALYLGAHPDASAARDAQVPVQLHIRMRVVHTAPVGRARERATGHPEPVARLHQLAPLLRRLQRPFRQLRDDQLQRPESRPPCLGILRPDHHALGCGRGAPGNDTQALDANQARPARPLRAEPVVMTQRRHPCPGRADRPQHGSPLGHRDKDVADPYPHHSSSR